MEEQRSWLPGASWSGGRSTNSRNSEAYVGAAVFNFSACPLSSALLSCLQISRIWAWERHLWDCIGHLSKLCPLFQIIYIFIPWSFNSCQEPHGTLEIESRERLDAYPQQIDDFSEGEKDVIQATTHPPTPPPPPPKNQQPSQIHDLCSRMDKTWARHLGESGLANSTWEVGEDFEGGGGMSAGIRKMRLLDWKPRESPLCKSSP